MAAITTPDELVRYVADGLVAISGMPKVVQDSREEEIPPFVVVAYQGASVDPEQLREDPTATVQHHFYRVSHRVDVALCVDFELDRGMQGSKLTLLMNLVLPLANTFQTSDEMRGWSWGNISEIMENGEAEVAVRSLVMTLVCEELADV